MQEMLRLSERQALAYVSYATVTMAAPLLVAVAVLFCGGHLVLRGEVTLQQDRRTTSATACSSGDRRGGHLDTCGQLAAEARAAGRGCGRLKR